MLPERGDKYMATTEPFLINPPKRIRRKVGRRRNPIGEMLVTIGANAPKGRHMRRRKSNPENPWYGDPAGHRIAALMRWGKIRRGKVSRHRKHVKVKRVVHRKRKHVVRHKKGRWALKHIRMRRKIAQQAFWTSKYGHMLAHPRSKKVFTRKGLVTMRRRKRNTWFGQPRRHRKAAKKGWRRGHKIGRRTIRHGNPRRRYRRNPEVGAVMHNRARHRRHYNRARRHRNPMGLSLGKLTSSFTNVRSWAPLAVTGGLSAITGAVVPTMIGIQNPWAKLGAQLVVAIGGGLVVEKFVDARHGQAWMVVGVSMVGYQLLKQFVLVPYAPQFAVGLGDDYMNYYTDDQSNEVSQTIGAYPQEVGAFPSAMSAYPGVGGDDMVGAYPYDGSPY